MERKYRQYFTYVKSVFLLAILVTMVFNPLSGGITSNEITQSPISSEISQPEFLLSDVYENYFMTEIDDGYWLDAVANGVNLNLNVDDGSTPLALPFSFLYYDTSFSTVYIGSNGWLSFTNTNPDDYGNPTFPRADSYYAYCVAPFWDDLVAQSNVYAWSTSEFVAIQYNNIILYPSGPVAGTFEVVFHSNGTIDFNYLEILNAFTATVGLNYGDGVFYNSYPYTSLLGVTTFTLRFEYAPIGSELSADLVTPTYGVPGITNSITAIVENIGSNDETDVELYLYLDEVIVGSTTFPLLASGESGNFSYEWTPTSEGIYNFTVYVEPVLDELNLVNNRVTRFVGVYSGLPYAVFYDYLPWDFNSTCEILADYGIPYDIFGSSDMGVVDLSGYQKVVISSAQSTVFMDAIYANLAWFEEYAEGGGTLEIHAANWYPWVNGEVPGGVTYVDGGEDYVSIVDPMNEMVTYPNLITDEELDGWSSSVHGHLEDVSPGANVIIETGQGYPALIEFNYGTGYIIVSSQTLEFGFGNEYSRILENILLYSPTTYQHDVSIYLECPGRVTPGEQISLNITIANIGLNPETELQFGIRINDTEIYTGIIPTLENGTIFETTIMWNLFTPGIYNICAFVEPVPEENVTRNNQATRLVQVRSIVGYVLWDQGHMCWDSYNYDYFIDELEYLGYIVDTTTELLNNTDLPMYSVLVLGAPETSFTVEEQAAIQQYVIDGGGLLAFSGNTPSNLNSITSFAGIEWLGASTECNTTDIIPHDVTEGVDSVYFYYPTGILNATAPAVSLVNDTSMNTLVAVSEIGLGRVVAIGDPAVLYHYTGLDIILWADNLILGINSINWLSESSYYNIITDTQRDLEVVRYMDSAIVTCNVIDSFGIDTVELFYRVDGGSWQIVIMTHVSGDEYQSIIPAQSWACFTEYLVCSTNLHGFTNVDDNDGLYYTYTVTDPILPDVEITSPAADGTVSGMVPISVTAVDVGSGISYVEFYLDGVLIGTDSTGPYELEWDSSTVDDGSHTLMARGYDGAGNDAEVSISLIIDNVATTTTTTTTSTNTTTTSTVPDTVLVTIMIIAGGAVIIIVIVIVIKKQK